MNHALIVVDAQNEFSSTGLRPVPGHAGALAAILDHVAAARAERRPIAWSSTTIGPPNPGRSRPLVGSGILARPGASGWIRT